jgi:hypothetical protein
MKQKLYIFGLMNSLIIFTGVIFKVNHFPGAGILLTIGLATLVLFFIPAALINNYRNSENKSLLLYSVTWLTCFVVFTAMLFKIQHWPGAGIALTIAVPFPYVVFLPVFLAVTSKIRNFNIYNTVFVLLLLALNSVFSALLALNVSKTRIDDSLNVTRNYSRIEAVLGQLPGAQINDALNIKIDAVLKTVNEYRDLILKQEGLTKEQWNNSPETLWRPDAQWVAAIPLYASNESNPGERLEAGLKDLIEELDKTQVEGQISTAEIFNYSQSAEDEQSWGSRTFAESTLSWALTYLDGLEVNLRMLKISLSAMN